MPSEFFSLKNSSSEFKSDHDHESKHTSKIISCLRATAAAGDRDREVLEMGKWIEMEK